MKQNENVLSIKTIERKATVKQATKTCNLFCNTVVKRVEYRCCMCYHSQNKTVLQQIKVGATARQTKTSIDTKDTIKHQRQVSTAIMMYKTAHGMTPDYLTSKFVSRDEITSYRLRNTENKLVLPLPRTNYLKKSFSYSGAKLWNSLSHDLRSADSLHDFKRKLCRNSFE